MALSTAELKKYLKLLQQVQEKEVEIANSRPAEQDAIARIAQLVTQNVAQHEKVLAAKRDELDSLEELGKLHSRNGRELQKQIKYWETLVNAQKEGGMPLTEAGKQFIGQNGDLVKRNKLVGEGTKLIKAQTLSIKDLSMTVAESKAKVAEQVKKFTKQNEDLGISFKGNTEEVQGMWTKIAGSLSKIAGPAMAVGKGLAKEAGEMNLAMVNSVASTSAQMVDGLDEKFRGMVKSTGHYSKDMQTIFINNMTGRADNVSEMVDKSLGDLKLLDDVFIHPEDSIKAMEALRSSTGTFHEELKAGRTGIANYMSSMVAGFTKLGVTQETSAKAINIANKALGQSPALSVEFMKKIKRVGTAIGQNINDTFTEMIQAAPKITMFGDRTVEVFGKIAAQAKAAGVSTNTLLDTAMKFDTFEGAADAAGKLNAVLGQTAVDVMELVHADPDEKIDIIRRAVEGTIGGFDKMDRRTQQVIAGIISSGDTQLAAQMLGNKGAFDMMANNLEAVSQGGKIQAETQEQLSKQMMEAGSLQDRLKASASQAADLVHAVTKVKRGFAQGIYMASDFVAGGFQKAGQFMTNAANKLKSALGIGGKAPPGVTGIQPPQWEEKGQVGFDPTKVQKFSDSAQDSLGGVHNKILDMKIAAEAFHTALGGGIAPSVKNLDDMVERMEALKKLGRLDRRQAQLLESMQATRTAGGGGPAMLAELRALAGTMRPEGPAAARAVAAGTENLTPEGIQDVSELLKNDLNKTATEVGGPENIDWEKVLGARFDTLDRRTQQVLERSGVMPLQARSTEITRPGKHGEEGALLPEERIREVTARPPAEQLDISELREYMNSLTETTDEVRRLATALAEVAGRENVVNLNIDGRKFEEKVHQYTDTHPGYKRG